jgi:ABC-2 family transporter protein
MMLNLLDRIGDWNPQLFREVKGRLKLVPVLLVLCVSLVSQGILFGVTQFSDMPGANYQKWDRYCSINQEYQTQRTQLQKESRQLQDQFFRYSGKQEFDAEKLAALRPKIEKNKQTTEALETWFNSFTKCPADRIDWQRWKLDKHRNLFQALSTIATFILIVCGSYLLSHDFVKEGQRGTLDFLRMSPQSASSILMGKLLGVPISVYLFVGLAIPLQIWAGLSAHISLARILSFDLILVVASLFFSSVASLLSLANVGWKTFIPWLVSGAFLFFLSLSFAHIENNSTALQEMGLTWGLLFAPFIYLKPLLFHVQSINTVDPYRYQPIVKELSFLGLRIGSQNSSLMALIVANYALWTYWAWQGIVRCFHSHNASIFSKAQSYSIVFSAEFLMLGFTIYPNGKESNSWNINEGLGWFYIVNLVFLFGLILILTPHRQTLQDWSRYRHQNPHHSLSKGWQDWLNGEHSPALFAIAIDLAIVFTPLLVWSILPGGNLLFDSESSKLKILLMLALFGTFAMICATLVQLILLVKTPKRSRWAAGVLAALFFGFPIVLVILRIRPDPHAMVWLMSGLPWAALSSATFPELLTALLAQIALFSGLFWQLQRQLKSLGQSQTKMLLNSQPHELIQ